MNELRQKSAEDLHENKTLFGDDTGAYDSVATMDYLQRVLSEVLRLYPSVPMEGKYCIKRDVLPDGTVVEPLTSIQFSPYSFGRNEAIWGPTALQFDPDRWLTKTPTQFEFPAFNAGPRLCLGRSVAYLEAKLLLSKILPKMRLRVVPNQEIAPSLTVTMPIRNGLRVFVEQYKV